MGWVKPWCICIDFTCHVFLHSTVFWFDEIVALCCLLGGLKSWSHLLSLRLASRWRSYCCETSLKVEIKSSEDINQIQVLTRNIFNILWFDRSYVSDFSIWSGNQAPATTRIPHFLSPTLTTLWKVVSDQPKIWIYFCTSTYFELSIHSHKRKKFTKKTNRKPSYVRFNHCDFGIRPTDL